MPAGEYLSGGLAVVLERETAVEVRVTALSAPGTLLNLLYGRGQRRFVLTFPEWAALDVELIETTWQASGQRLFRFQAMTARPGLDAR